MYASGYMDHYSDFETYQSNLVSDPESSSVIDSEEETIEEDSSDVAEDDTNDDNDRESRQNESAGNVSEDPEVSERSSGSDLSVDNHNDSSDLLSDRWDDQEEETDEEDSAGTPGEDVEISDSNGSGSYRITIEGDPEEVGELIRILNREEEENAGDDFDNFESDGDDYNRELDNGDTEYVEYDSIEYNDGSGDTESSTESSTRLPEDSSDADEFYLRNIELLGIIAGCLYFIVFVIILKYIYKFFRLFI